jgi:hypothetical protein
LRFRPPQCYRRLRGDLPPPSAYDLCFSRRITRRQLLDKLPFLAIAAAAVLLTTNAQDRDSALIESGPPAIARLALLAKIFALYVGRTLLPIRLSAFYSVGGEPTEGPIVFIGALLAIGLIVGFFSLRRKNPAAAFGIALFLLPLATVMNFFFTLRIWMTDRYLLFPTIGSSLALVALAAPLFRQRGAERPRPARAPCADGLPLRDRHDRALLRADVRADRRLTSSVSL